MPTTSSRFPAAFVEEVRARANLYEIAGRHVQWHAGKSNPSRRDWWACCPFHQEKTPSFHVDEAKGFYYCFGCQAKGDVISFVMEIERLSYPEAIKSLASRLGIQPETFSRVAARLVKDGLIRVRGQDVVLLDLDGLRACAED